MKIKNKLLLLLVSSLFISNAMAETPDIEPQPDKILKQMSTYLAGIKQFTVDSHSTIEIMLDSGQKIMLAHDNSASVSRPDKFYGTRNGDAVEQSFYYNGKSFTLYSHKHNYYAQVKAPDQLATAFLTKKVTVL